MYIVPLVTVLMVLRHVHQEKECILLGALEINLLCNAIL